MKRRLGPKGQVVIPKEIREKLRLNEGATLTFEVSGKTILVTEEFVEQVLSVKGKKSRKLVDWKSDLDGEYKVPG